MTTQAAELSHAEQNARGWLETIRQYHACLTADRDRLEELRDARENFSFDEDANAAPDGPGYASDLEAWAGENPEDAAELAELEAAVNVEGEELSEDECRERILEGPLSLEVRSDWHTPGDQDGTAPAEYLLLLSTGGPALRIVGGLDRGEPTSARLEHQDWGTPWTEMPLYEADDRAALLAYVGCFYFGE